MKDDFKEYLLKLRNLVASHIVTICNSDGIPVKTIEAVIETLMLYKVESMRVDSDLIDVLVKLKTSLPVDDDVIQDICRLWGDSSFNKAIMVCIYNDRADLIKDVIHSNLSYEKVLLLQVFQ